MDSPFPFSHYVTGKNFVGRKGDVSLLGNLLSQGEHVCIYEPPRTGKTSLIQETLFSLRSKGVLFSVGQFSAQNIRTPEQFLLRMGSTLIRMVASTPSECSALVERYLSGTHFIFDAAAYAERDEVLSLNWDWDDADVAALLSFPFRLAQERGDRMMLIVDEFQCIGQMDDADGFFRQLDASLRENRDNSRFSYLFCGSAVNAMDRIFHGSRLFSRIVERVCLSPVDEREMTDQIYRGFLTSGKSVDKNLLQAACHLFRGHVWYINTFAFYCDSMSRGFIMEPMLEDALSCLLSQHAVRFNAVMSDLTTHQVNLLKAVVDGVTRFSSADVIRQYDLHSSANVKRVKDALMKKEVLLFDESDRPVIIDPLFEYWVRKYYFEQKNV